MSGQVSIEQVRRGHPDALLWLPAAVLGLVAVVVVMVAGLRLYVVPALPRLLALSKADLVPPDAASAAAG